MPKVLSLKKAQQTCPQKNQKSITHFFKNNADNNNLQSKGPPKITSLPKSTEQQPAKRKASSPTLQDRFHVVGESSIGSSVINPVVIVYNSPKKLKTSDRDNLSPIKEYQKKKITGLSPKKTNLDSAKNIHDFQINQKQEKKLPKKENVFTDLHSYDLEKSFDDNFEISYRLPLTPITTGNSIENHDVLKNDIKSSYFESKTHEKGCVTTCKTPEKISPHKHGNSSEKKINTPKKSPIQEFYCSPITKLGTPDKNLTNVVSPSKCGSTVKSLDFNEHDICHEFGEAWGVDDLDENGAEDLELSTMQQCEVVTVKHHGTRLELRLKNANNNWATCFIEGFWIDTPLTPGDIISVLARRDTSGNYCIGNTSGLLVLRPDHLISSTSVVAGVFCKRKAVMQERWRGIDPANTAMTIGILIHELVQKALTQNIMTTSQLRSETDSIIKESIQMLYDAGLSEEETLSNMQVYIAPLAEFMQKYVADNPAVTKGPKDKNNWCGHVDKVLDIEENLCCPQLGLKGKIDATLQVTIHDRKGHQQSIVPLELKSGKASVSAEHRGQLVLYGMMLSLLRNEDPTQSVQRGLLLYLRERVDLREVSCGYPERRDLLMLRNQLVQYLAQGPLDVDPEQLVDIENASVLLQQKLPDPVHHETACAKCPYLTLCSLHLWHTDGPSVTESHPLSKLREQALGHLSADHIQYFLHWTALLRMEERGQMASSPLHALWTDSIEKRSKRGTCAANLKLKTVKQSGDRHLHVFERQDIDKEIENNKATKGPQEGEFSIVSIENRPWIAAGVILVAKQKEIHILLERDLGHRLNKDTLFTIDTYESYATTVQNLTNLGILIEDSDRADRLRKIIIDKMTPEFDKKLPRDVGRLGSKLMRSLNIEQQRAVLKAIAAKDYALLQGLPGTGKTQTISILIQMLVGLKQRVLVTAHTHSAVDTVLARLPDTMKVMRLGSAARVLPSLHNRTELSLASACDNPEKLGLLYDSMEVVGVTCLGATHAMLARTVFDVCIVDEATQVLQSTVLRPLFSAKRFVLVGDPEQLPPVVRSRAARRLGMEESLFHRLMNEDVTSTLQLQYRMNQALADIANKVAYNERLKCADEKVANATIGVDTQKIPQLSSSWLQMACSTEPKHAALFLDMQSINNLENCNNNKSCTNEDEACIVHALVDALKEVGVKTSDIGVIAPFRDQVSLLRRSLARFTVDVSTVDQFQGRDKSVIIYSCTKRDDRQEDKKVKEGEVLNDQRRLAVSVTRAKHKLLIVGNVRALHRYTPLQRLIDACTTLPLDQNAINSVRLKYKTLWV